MVFSPFTLSEIGRYEDLDRSCRCYSFTQIISIKTYNVRAHKILKSTLKIQCLHNLFCAICARNCLEQTYTCLLLLSGIYPAFFPSFSLLLLCMLFRREQVTPKGVWVIDVLVSCWLTSWLHTLEEGMRYMAVGQSQSPRTYFISRPPFPMDQSSVHPHTSQVEQAKGRVVLGVNCDPGMNTLVLLLCLMGNSGVSWSWTLVSKEVNAAIVFWHGAAAD